MKALILMLVLAAPFGRAWAGDDDPLKPFPLLERGFVAGAGIGMQTGGIHHAPYQTGASTGGFAYLGVLPGYWRSGQEITHKYCASIGDDPQAAADLAAAEKTYPDASPEEVKAKLTRTPVPASVKVETLTKIDPDKVEKQTGWELNKRGRCFASMTWLGAFVALPTSYTVNVRETDSSPGLLSREVHPYGSFGVLIAVQPYLHLLAGITISHVGVGTSDSAKEQVLYSPFFGIGTTIDVLGAIFK